MKFTLLFLSVSIISAFSLKSMAQNNDSIFNKAKYYYENQEYMMAIPWFTKYIASNPGYYKTYQLRGNCYLETGQSSNSINDFLYAYQRG